MLCFKVRSIHGNMKRGDKKNQKQGFHPDPPNTDHTSHHSTSSAILMNILNMNKIWKSHTTANTKIIQKHIFTFITLPSFILLEDSVEVTVSLTDN